jgi:hypothetical protein
MVFQRFSWDFHGFIQLIPGISIGFPVFFLRSTTPTPLRRQFFDLVQSIIQTRQEGLAKWLLIYG